MGEPNALRVRNATWVAEPIAVKGSEPAQLGDFAVRTLTVTHQEHRPLLSASPDTCFLHPAGCLPSNV